MSKEHTGNGLQHPAGAQAGKSSLYVPAVVLASRKSGQCSSGTDRSSAGVWALVPALLATVKCGATAIDQLNSAAPTHARALEMPVAGTPI